MFKLFAVTSSNAPCVCVLSFYFVQADFWVIKPVLEQFKVVVLQSLVLKRQVEESVWPPFDEMKVTSELMILKIDLWDWSLS